jgi:hypothetical protein
MESMETFEEILISIPSGAMRGNLPDLSSAT